MDRVHCAKTAATLRPPPFLRSNVSTIMRMRGSDYCSALVLASFAINTSIRGVCNNSKSSCQLKSSLCCHVKSVVATQETRIYVTDVRGQSAQALPRNCCLVIVGKWNECNEKCKKRKDEKQTISYLKTLQILYTSFWLSGVNKKHL